MRQTPQEWALLAMQAPSSLSSSLLLMLASERLLLQPSELSAGLAVAPSGLAGVLMDSV